MVAGMPSQFSAYAAVLAAACAAVVSAAPANADTFDDLALRSRFSLTAPEGPTPFAQRPMIVAVPKDEAKAALARPVPGAVASPYGLRMHPILGYVRLHAGVDLHAPCGTPVSAAAAGRVIFAGWGESSGWYVALDHGVLNGHRVVTTYSHLEQFAVAAGESISRGQGIGLAGSTGLSTGCHLHFEVRVDGTAVDPQPWLTSRNPEIRVASAPPRPVSAVPDRGTQAPSPSPAPTQAPAPSPAPSPKPSPSPSPSAP